MTSGTANRSSDSNVIAFSARKPYVWPVYVTQTRARHRCPTRLLVVTIDAGVARWCSRPIETGHPGVIPNEVRGAGRRG
ncbi:hypothetical protein WME88_44120 [Sorangium sp. So ce216]